MGPSDVQPPFRFPGRPTTLHGALALSLLVHAVLLTLRFFDPASLDRTFKDTPLEVVLVNARSQQKPDQAQAIAQASLAGGGQADQGRATSPMVNAAMTQSGDALHDEEQQIEALKKRQDQVLSQLRQQLSSIPAPEMLAERLAQADAEREQQRQALVKILAEIEKRIQEENARPKKRYISPATSEAIYAIYYDGLRRRIEERGTRQFPQDGGRKLYGELTMMITLSHTGAVLQTEVVRRSDNPVLDRQAQALVQTLVFEPFTQAMRQHADQIVVVSRFRFTRDDTLLTQQTPP
jgi:protein TonB